MSPGYEAVGRNSAKKTGFITTRNVSREIREAMRPKFNWRPYVLRAYFDTQLLLAESHGKIAHSYGVFFMGHIGDIESRYTRCPAGQPGRGYASSVHPVRTLSLH